jgi:hydroxymethylpyrimidine/phosphomethylpyrimidine kinase
MLRVLAIAGSDPSGGAGIQADIKTITMHHVYAMAAITALTAQNTTGVFAVEETSGGLVAAQIDAVFADIVPHAVKVGMLASAEIVTVVADRLKHYGARNVVVDPVMVSTSGGRLLNDDALEALVGLLFPLARVITPNIPEAEVLVGHRISDEAAMAEAAEAIGRRADCAVLVKGGHGTHDASDVLYDNGRLHWLRAERIDNPNTHGTGCTLSSAIACGLAAGLPLCEAVRRAKEYLVGAIAAQLDLGAGSGPLDHAFCVPSRF